MGRTRGLPAAFFEIEIRNTSAADLTYTTALVVQNPLEATVNRLKMAGPGLPAGKDSPEALLKRVGRWGYHHPPVVA